MNKEIEIPFGAKDSELKGWEYTIPENMEAEIKDGKIMVREKVSEDERIREAIESIIRVYGKTQGEWIAGYDMDTLVVHLRDAFAYLERQKEQKPTGWDEEDDAVANLILKELEQDKKDQPDYSRHFTRLIDWFIHRFKSFRSLPDDMIQWTGNNLKEVIDFTGKSPKFDEWFKSWEDFENYVHSHGDILKLFCEDGSHYEVPLGAWIVKTPDGFNIPSHFRFVQKPAEWSEEDKVMLNNIIWSVHMKSIIKPLYEMDDRSKYKKYEDFLKSLPERFNLQPEQEVVDRTVFDRIADILRWCDLPIGCPVENFKESESEREHLLNIVQCVAHRYANSCTYCKEYSRGYQDGLAVHRWKPNEEQILAIVEALKYIPNNKKEWIILENLMDDLKKL